MEEQAAGQGQATQAQPYFGVVEIALGREGMRGREGGRGRGGGRG